MGINEKAWHVGFKWTIGNEDVPAGAIAVDNTSKQLHICDIEDVGTDWARAVASHPELYIHSATTPESDYIKLYHDGDYAYLVVDGTTLLTMTTTSLAIAVDTAISGDLDLLTEDISVAAGKYIYLDGPTGGEYLVADEVDALTINATTNMHFAIGTNDELKLTSTVFSPAVSGGSALGSTSLYWQDLFLESGGVVNFNNDVILTHYPGTLGLESLLHIDASDDAAIHMVGANRINFRTSGNLSGGGTFISSHAANAMTIQAYGSGEATFYVRSNGGQFHLSNTYLRLNLTDVDGQYEGDTWMDDSEDKIKYYGGSAVRTVVSEEQINTFEALQAFNVSAGGDSTGIYMTGANRINLRTDGDLNSGGTFISSHAADAMTIQAFGSGEATFYVRSNGGQFHLSNTYLRLNVTDVDGQYEGDTWFDESEKMIKFYGNGAVRTLIDTTRDVAVSGEWTHTDTLNMSGSTRIKLGSPTAYITNQGAGMVLIRGDAASQDAITLHTAGVGGGIFLDGILRLSTYAGTVDGQIWYDSAQNKFLGRSNGSTVDLSTAN